LFLQPIRTPGFYHHGKVAALPRYLLPAVVFLTGACVLIVEVLAVRVFSPYYGNTIFTVSSVITVILLALFVLFSLASFVLAPVPTT